MYAPLAPDLMRQEMVRPYRPTVRPISNVMQRISSTQRSLADAILSSTINHKTITPTSLTIANEYVVHWFCRQF
jgi:hypothetical protein